MALPEKAKQYYSFFEMLYGLGANIINIRDIKHTVAKKVSNNKGPSV